MERLKQVNRIILSVGHGGLDGEVFDTGAVANGVTEHEQCRQILGYLVVELLRGGVAVLVAPDWRLGKTIEYINRNGNTYQDWAIEIHKDSAVYDVEKMHRRCGMYFLAESAGSGAIARRVIERMITEGAHSTSWARVETDSPRKSLAFCRQPKMLSHIVELGFIEGDNSDAENRWYASALAKSILFVLQNR